MGFNRDFKACVKGLTACACDFVAYVDKTGSLYVLSRESQPKKINVGFDGCRGGRKKDVPVKTIVLHHAMHPTKLPT